MSLLGEGLIVVCIGQIFYLTRKVTRIEKNNETLKQRCPLLQDKALAETNDNKDADK